MATDYIRAKIDQLKAQLANESVNLFNHELIIEDAQVPIGDPQADDEMKAAAARAVITAAAIRRRIDVRQKRLAELLAEQDAERKAAKPST